jgi:two-component system cell cycle sensor histidine kinase/response regulator CckA
MVGPQLLIGWQWDPSSGVVTLGGSIPALGALPLVCSFDALIARVHPDHQEAVRAALRSTADSREAFAIEFPTSGHRRSTLRILARPVVLDGRRQLIGTVEDVTSVRQEQQHSVRSNRLASLGMLAAGVAHDFNNLLTVISMRADLLGGALEAEGVERELYDEDVTAGLTRQLTLFAGAGGGPAADVEITAVVDGLRPLLASSRGGAVAMHYVLEDCPPVHCDRTQVEQVVLNLVINARDAVAEAARTDGRDPRVTVVLRPMTEPDEIADRNARAGELVPGRAAPPGWVLIEIADNGIGMSPEVREKAFDPFFTTKGAGRGTGLGLSVVFGIVEHLGGTLDIESVPGQGTTVRVALPATTAPAVPVAGESAGPGRVLVVDDDAAVRAITSRILAAQGYDVVSASSGEEALLTLESSEPFSIVVSDVVMGQMTGMVLAERLASERPNLPVLLVTGFAPPAELVAHPLLDLVTKPLTGASLVAAVKSLLDRAGLKSSTGERTAA